MWITVEYKNAKYRADLSDPLDISIPLEEGLNTVNCFFAPPAEFTPHCVGDFVGSVAEGAPVNFFNVRFNPHGNGTHTECVGHISDEGYTIHDSLNKFHFVAKLVSILPTKTVSGDRIILREQLEEVLGRKEAEALIIRTLPNDTLKYNTHYSGANPPYLDRAAAQYIVECGVSHLLVDLPSIDREEDEGKLLAHHAFWQFPDDPRENATISELIFVDNTVEDGIYLLNIQIASFMLDVSPSKPVLYRLHS